MFKRIGLFLITNLLVVITISIILNVLGVGPYLTQSGIDYQSLLIFCLVWGMGGAFISLALSRTMAKMALGVKTIDPTSPGEFAPLVQMVAQLARSAGLPETPEVGVYQSPEVNAFATGPSKRRALVAFSTGLLNRMNRDEIEGVAGHEIAHIANGDMVTMTLLQGVINAFVMFLARVIGFAMSNSSRDGESRGHQNYFVVLLLEIVLGFLGSMVVAWFSRGREFRADAGSARYAGREKMIAGLKNLQRYYQPVTEGGSLATFKISGKSSGGITALFATHPPLEERIRRLETMNVLG